MCNINKINETTRVANENMNENQTKIQVEMETVMEIEIQQNVHICAEDQHKDQDKHKYHTWKVAGRGGTVSESHLRK